MTTISMGNFIDYVLTSGTSRINLARAIRDEAGTDFYKPVRETIVDMHQRAIDGEKVDGEALDAFLGTLVDEREIRIFPKVVKGYRRFLRQSADLTNVPPRWFEPPMRDLPLGPITVRVLPELALVIGGRPHAIKLFLRGDPISPQRVMVTNRLMCMAFAATWPGTVYATLDVRRARLYPYRPKAGVDALLHAEAASLSSLMGRLECSR